MVHARGMQTTRSMHTAGIVTAVRAQIFPLQADRWIAVVGAPGSTFVTEARSAAGVASQIRHAIEASLGWVPEMELVDDLGRPWSPGQAPAQLARNPRGGRSPRPPRTSWWRRRVAALR